MQPSNSTKRHKVEIKATLVKKPTKKKTQARKQELPPASARNYDSSKTLASDQKQQRKEKQNRDQADKNPGSKTQRLGPDSSPIGTHMTKLNLLRRGSSRMNKSKTRLVTFREMREIQRQMEMTNVGPGSTEHLKPFGSQVPYKIHFGQKYKFKTGSNPGPGAYEVGKADKLTKSSSQAPSIRPKTKEGAGNVPMIETDAGRYNPHKEFGTDLPQMTIGRRSRGRDASNTPPPGSYDPDKALKLTKPKSQALIMRRDSSATPSRLNQVTSESPDPGAYYDSIKGFGYNTPRITIGGVKEKWKPLNENPGPGEHEITQNLTRPRTPGIEMRKGTGRRDEFLATPGDDTPAPAYKVENTFGADLKSKMTLGGKPKWKPDNKNPGPGAYNGNLDTVKQRPKSTVNMNKEKRESRHSYLEGNKLLDVSYDTMKPFGADVTNNINFGSKYQWKPDKNPAPNKYDPKQKSIRPNAKTYSMSKTPRKTLQHIRSSKGMPSMGDYNTMKPFGSNAKKISFGGKYKTRTSCGPSPCAYEPSHKLVKPNVPGFKINNEQWVLLDESALMNRL